MFFEKTTCRRSLRLAGCWLAVVCAGGLAQDDEESPVTEPPVTIQPGKGETVESMRMANGQIRYKVTPRDGKPYCFIMEEGDPFDPFSKGATFRVPCGDEAK